MLPSFLEHVNSDFEALSLDLVRAMGATEEQLATIYARLYEDGFGEPFPGL